MPPSEHELAEADRDERRKLRREQLIRQVTQALVAAMDNAGLTQSQLADRMKRTRGHISQLLSGGRNLTLASIAEVGGCPAAC